MNIKPFLMAMTMLFMVKVNAQDKLPDFIKTLSSTSYEFELRKQMRPTYSTASDTGYIIIPYSVYIISLDINKLSEKYDKKSLIRALYNALSEEDKDWNANLLLYALTQRDAGLLMGVYSRKEWIKLTKKIDLKLWKESPVILSILNE